MPDESKDNLLARLAGHGDAADGSDPWAAIAVTEPEMDLPGAPITPDESDAAALADGDPLLDHQVDAKLDELLSRINQLRGGEPGTSANGAAKPAEPESDAFMPIEPETWDEAKVTEGEIESFILKYLLSRGNATGVEASDQVKLPFKLVEDLLRQLKNDQLVFYRGTSTMNDYQYQLTDMGRERARRYADHCTYFGSAPVALTDYIASVKAQSLTRQHPTTDDLHRAFADLLLNTRMLDRLGPAINSGRGSVSVRRARQRQDQHRRAGDQGLRPVHLDSPRDRRRRRDHPPVRPQQSRGGAAGSLRRHCRTTDRIDHRWVRIRRPTIVVGGELTMSALEVTLQHVDRHQRGAAAAEEQLRHAGDRRLRPPADEHRRTAESLDRAAGKALRLPEPAQRQEDRGAVRPVDHLLDEPGAARTWSTTPSCGAFPTRSTSSDPTEEEFRELFRLMAPKLGFECSDEAVDYLIGTHYRPVNRPFRCCQPRDLLLQIRNFCFYQNQPPEMTHGELRFRGGELLRGDVRQDVGWVEQAERPIRSSSSLSGGMGALV